MALRIVYTRGAIKDLRGLPPKDRDRVRARIAAYAETPDAPQHDVLHLVGSTEGYRLRVGNWRVVFNKDGGTLDVLRIGHRREVYR